MVITRPYGVGCKEATYTGSLNVIGGIVLNQDLQGDLDPAELVASTDWESGCCL